MSARRLLHALAWLALPALLAACGGSERATPDTAAPDTAASSPAPAFTPSDFRHLHWIAGDWRGRLPNGGAFYERYRVVDDSTIAMQGFPDSTFAAASDSSRIALRGGVVASEGAAARWEATRLDSAGVTFGPRRGASNSFTWTRNGADRWTAELRPAGGGAPTVYPMERMRR